MKSNRFCGEWRNSNGFERFVETKVISDQIVGLLAVHQFVPVMEQILEGFGRNTQIPSGLINRWAAAGGRRSKGGMPWSGRREDEAAR